MMYNIQKDQFWDKQAFQPLNPSIHNKICLHQKPSLHEDLVEAEQELRR